MKKEYDEFLCFVLCCFTPTGYRSNDPGHWGAGRKKNKKQKHEK
jgi:hypothetical protein